MVNSKETELIGGMEMYKPVCRGCFYKKEEFKEIRNQNSSVKENIQSDEIKASPIRTSEKDTVKSTVLEPIPVVSNENDDANIILDNVS